MLNDTTWQEQVREKALEIAGDSPLEEEHLNTAMLALGDIVPKEERTRLQQHLANVEVGISTSDDHLGYEEVEEYDDPAWCTGCNRDTAFCECICYVCYEQLEDCKCTCAQCNTPMEGGGLCEAHEAAWNEEVQGPAPDSEEQVGICTDCEIAFNRAFLLNAPHHPKFQPTAYLTERTLCIKCDTEGTFSGYM